MPKLRQLRLHTLDEVAADIRRLREGGYEKGGEWSLPQMCEHLTGTMRIGLDGSMKPFPWVLRATLGNAMFWLFVSRTLKPGKGVKTLPQLEPGANIEPDDSEPIDRCLATLAEARDRTEPLPPYPFTTKISNNRWRDMMVAHSEHHLEFLRPNGAS